MCPKHTALVVSGLEEPGLVPIVVLHGTATPPITETPEIVQERFDLSLKMKRLEKRLAAIDAVLKEKTGERQVGAFFVTVTSFNMERLDSDAARLLLGELAPLKISPSLRLSVVPA